MSGTSGLACVTPVLRHVFVVTSGLLFLAGCDAEEPPGLRQISCVAREPNLGADGVTFVFDIGRRSVVRASGTDHRTMPLAWNRYTYQFRGADGVMFTLNRFDGSLKLQHPANPAGRSSIVESWTCKTQKPGQSL